MSQTFDPDNDPLFHTVVEAVQRIITSIEYGIQFNEGSIEIEEPSGNYITLPRVQWKQELQAALGFFEESEYYEECARCQKCIKTLEAEPTVDQIIRQISDHANKQNKD